MSEVAQAIHSSPDGHIPQLRFPEFSGEWMTDELSNLIEISSNKFNPNTSNESKKCIELEHLSQETGELLGYTDSTAQASTKNAFTKGQVLFGKLRPYLKKFWLSQFDGVCSSEIWVLNGKKLANNYLFQFIQTNKFNQIANVSSGSKMPRSDWKYMVQVPFKYTTKPEQQKIAAFLTAVDNKIEQLSKKQELLSEYKKGVMQQIFSQAIRFKADDGSDFPGWEEKKLGSLCEITTGKLDANAMVKDGQYRFYTCAKEYYKIDDYAFDTDALIVSGNGANVGYIHHYQGKFNAYQRTYVLDSFTDNIVFVKFVLDGYLHKRIMKEKNEGNTPYIVMGTLTDMKINLPSFSEQTKISNFLSSIDSKIEQVSKQLDESKQFKKALLQQMFV